MTLLRAITAAELTIALRAHARYRQGLTGGRRAILQDRDFRGLDITDHDFAEAELSGSCFADVTAQRASFANAMAAGCDFRSADLSQADFTKAKLCGSSLKGAILNDAIFLHADLRPGFIATRGRGGVFERRPAEAGPLSPAGTARTDLSKARLTGANLKRAQLSGVEATGTDFSDAVLTRADLSGALLKSALFCGAILEDVRLANADLTDATFGRAILLGVDIGQARTDGLKLDQVLSDRPSGPAVSVIASMEILLARHKSWLESLGTEGARIDLSQADLRAAGGRLRGALLSMGTLDRAVLYHLALTKLRAHCASAIECDFRLADLTEADLRGSNLRGALLARVSGYRADFSALPIGGAGSKTATTCLTGANFRYADFREANFAGADLSGADFSFCDLTGANLTDALLVDADLTGTIGLPAAGRSPWSRRPVGGARSADPDLRRAGTGMP